ncbi:unnamed protein product [Acanthosepion pharaonis]|uniref:Uncharacterized protein n=1 Tax=Acanthosepion pharaonis TaxID=158019 RepID=A0A812E6C6_ACAPH|nr:unnamed protein product [Sepia pharaonis]
MPRGGTRRPGSPSSPYIPSRTVAHRATPSSPRQTDVLVYPLLWTLLAMPRGELTDVRAALARSAPRNSIVSRDRRMYWFILSSFDTALVLHISKARSALRNSIVSRDRRGTRPRRPGSLRTCATPSSLETDGCIGLSSPLDTASKAERGELDVRAALVLHISRQARSAPRNSISLETDGCIGLSSPLDIASKAEGELDVRAALVLHISRPGRRRTAQLHRLETDGCIGLSSPLDTASRAERGTRRPGSPSSPYIPSRPVAHRATPSSLETDGCIGLSSPLDTASKAERGNQTPVAHRATPSSPRQTDVLVYPLLWTLLAKAERRRPGSPSSPYIPSRLVAHRATPSSLETDGSRPRWGTRRPGSPSSPYIPSRPVAHRATPSSPRQTDVLVYPLLWTLLARLRGELDVRAALVLHISRQARSAPIVSRDNHRLSRQTDVDVGLSSPLDTDVLARSAPRNTIFTRDRRMYWPVAHRATPSSLETDGCIGLSSPLDTASKAERGTRRPGSPSSPYIPSRPVAHRATPSSPRQTDVLARQPIVSRDSGYWPVAHPQLHRLETDGCIGLSSPLDTASKAERGTRRPGSPSSPYIPSRLVAHRATPSSRDRRMLVAHRATPSFTRDRRMYWFILSFDTASNAERGTRRPGSPSSPYILSRPVAHRATPSSPETDGCIGLSSPWTLLARPRGELDAVAHRATHCLSRQTDVLVYPPLDTPSKAERGTRRPGSPSSPYILLVAHRATPSSLETDDVLVYPPLDTASKAERGTRRGQPSSPYIPSRPVAHRASSSPETDGCIGLSPLDQEGAERGTRRPGSASSPYPVQARSAPRTHLHLGDRRMPVAHRATPSSPRDRRMHWFILSFDTASNAERGELDVRAALVLHISRPGLHKAHRATHHLETDGCIGLSSPLTLLAMPERGTRRPGSSVLHIRPGPPVAQPNSIVSRQTDVLVYILLDTASKGREGELDVRAALVLHISCPGPPVAHRATPFTSRQTDVLVYPLPWTLRGELDVRAAQFHISCRGRSGQPIVSRPDAARNSLYPRQLVFVTLLKAERQTDVSPRDRRVHPLLWTPGKEGEGGTPDVQGSPTPSSPYIPVQAYIRSALRNSICLPGDRRMYWARSAPRNSIVSRQTDVLVYPPWTLLRPRGGTRRPGSPSSPYIPSRPVAHCATPSSRDRRMYWFILSFDTASKGREGGTRRPQPLVLHISCPGRSALRNSIVTSRQTDVLACSAPGATPSSLETDGCPPYIPSRFIVSRQTLDTASKAERGTRRPGSLSSPYPVQARKGHRATHRLSRQTDVLVYPPLDIAERGTRRPRGGTWVQPVDVLETALVLHILPRGGTRDVRAALVLHISRPASRSALRNSIFTETDGCIGLSSLDTASNAERGTRRPQPSSPYIPSRLVAHRATPSSLETDDVLRTAQPHPETDGCIGLSLLGTLLARLRGGTRRPGSPSSPVHISASTHHETDALLAPRNPFIGLSLPWTLLARPRGGTRRPGSPSSPYILSRRVAHRAQLHRLSRDRRMLVAQQLHHLETDGCAVYPPLSRPRGELDVRAAPSPYIPSRPVAHRATPSSRDRRMYWFILLWTILAMPRGELDVRAALVSIYPQCRGGNRRRCIAHPSRTDRPLPRTPGEMGQRPIVPPYSPDGCNSIRDTDGINTLLARPRGELGMSGQPSSPYPRPAERGTSPGSSISIYPVQALAHCATPRPKQTGGLTPCTDPSHRAIHPLRQSRDTVGREGKRPGSPTPYPVQARRQQPIVSRRQTDVVACSALRNPSSRDRRMYWFIPLLSLLARPRGEPQTSGQP